MWQAIDKDILIGQKRKNTININIDDDHDTQCNCSPPADQYPVCPGFWIIHRYINKYFKKSEQKSVRDLFLSTKIKNVLNKKVKITLKYIK